MKKLISTVLMAFVCLGAMAEVDTKEYRVYVKNDHHVFYCEHNGVTVVVDPTADGLFYPHITIINESGHDFVFEPKKIKVHAFAIPGNTMKSTRYRVERFLAKGDTLGFEKDELMVYTPEKFNKKLKRTLWWANFLSTAVVAVVNSVGEQTEESRYRQMVNAEKQNEAYNETRAEIDRVCEDYWRANTIFDCSEHEGFIAIKKVKTKYLILDIPVDGENFHFLIDNYKKY